MLEREAAGTSRVLGGPIVEILQPENERLDRPDSPLQAMSYIDLQKLKVPPRQYLLEPWLSKRGLAMVYAPRGIGKTLFALAVAYAVASGASFLGFTAPAPSRVLYIDGEMSLLHMQERVAAITGGEEKVDPSFLGLLSSDALDGRMPDLGTIEGQQQLAPLVEKYDLIIIDNVSTLVRTGGENDGDSWRVVQEWELKQRRAGRAVLLVHHTNKKGTQRGTSKHEDVLDTVLSLSRPDGYGASDGAHFTLTFEKTRGFYGADAEPLEAHYSVENGRRHWTFGPIADERTERAAVLFDKGLTVRKVADELGISKTAAGLLRQEWEKQRAKTERVPVSRAPGSEKTGQAAEASGLNA